MASDNGLVRPPRERGGAVRRTRVTRSLSKAVSSTAEYENRDGVRVREAGVVGEEIVLLGGKRNDSQGGYGGGGGGHRPAPPSPLPPPNPPRSPNPTPAPHPPLPKSKRYDDLPFTLVQRGSLPSPQSFRILGSLTP